MSHQSQIFYFQDGALNIVANRPYAAWSYGLLPFGISAPSPPCSSCNICHHHRRWSHSWFLLVILDRCGPDCVTQRHTASAFSLSIIWCYRLIILANNTRDSAISLYIRLQKIHTWRCLPSLWNDSYHAACTALCIFLGPRRWWEN